jgi:hypothetical protein
MIPIWAKNMDGKWEVFPAHLLETFADGKQGISDYQCITGQWPWPIAKKWIHLFTYDAAHSRSILKKQL